MTIRSSLPKVDAHHHIWDLQRNYHPWLRDSVPPRRVYGDSAPLRRDYLIDHFLHDARNQNVVKSVYLQCGWDPADPVGETRYVQSVADAQPQGFPHAIVAHADLHHDDVEHVLEGHCAYTNMRGIRMLLSHHAAGHFVWAERGDYLTDPDWIRGYGKLAAFGLSFDCQCYPHQMPAMAAVAAAHADVPLIIDHSGMPIERESFGMERWHEGLAMLARLPHASIKISGMSMVMHEWNAEKVKPFFRTIIDLFGPDRVMAASNFPVDKLKGDYDTHFDAFAYAIADLPTADQAKIFHDTAVRVYRL